MTVPPSFILDGIRDILRGMEVEQQVELDTHVARDLGLDSIRRIELAMEVENRFRVRLEPEDEEGIETIGNLEDVIRRHLSATGECGSGGPDVCDA